MNRKFDMRLRLGSLLFLGASLFSLLGVNSCQSSDPIELRIFHTNDIHSRFRGAKTDAFGYGGMARISTLLQQLRKDIPRSLTLDGGDWSEGSWYFSVDAGANMLKAFDMMGYDAVGLGNHDFLAGPDAMIRYFKQSTVPVLAANLNMSAYLRSEELRKVVPSSMIKDVGGVKVGIIGLTTFQLLYDSYIAPVKITDVVEAATEQAQLLRSQVDVLVLISHNDLEINTELARVVPGLDVVISGHSHKKLYHPLVVQNAGRAVPVVETGEWGKFLGDLTLELDPKQKTVRMKKYELHAVSSDLAEDPRILSWIEEQDRILSARYGHDVHEVMAQSEFTLSREDHQESPLGNLAARAYRVATGADLALEEISLTGFAIPQGDVTYMDLHDVVPHIYNPDTGKEWELNVWDAQGSDLQTVVNVFYIVNGLMPLAPLGWLSADGAEITWDPGVKSQSASSAPSVRSIRVGGKPISLTAHYKVALSDGLLLAVRLASEKLNLRIDLSRMNNTHIEAWQAVASYGAQMGRLKREDLGVGGRARTIGPDLGFFQYSMNWDGERLQVEIQNLGLKSSALGSIRCFSGVPNNGLLHQTDDQVWTEFASAPIPTLTPGSKVVTTLNWSSKGLQPGLWPVRCDVASVGDQQEINNHAERVFKVQAR